MQAMIRNNRRSLQLSQPMVCCTLRGQKQLLYIVHVRVAIRMFCSGGTWQAQLRTKASRQRKQTIWMTRQSR